MKDRTIGNGLTTVVYTMALEAGKTQGKEQAGCVLESLLVVTGTCLEPRL